MLPFLIGGVALAATGYGVKKYLESDENCEKVQEALFKGCDWLDEVSEKSEYFFDGVHQYIEEYFDDNEEELENDGIEDIDEEISHEGESLVIASS